MFTRIMKGMLTATMIIIALAAIATGIEYNSFLTFIIILGVGILSLAFIGMIVELANNVLDIKILLQNKQSNSNKYSYDNNSTSSSYLSGTAGNTTYNSSNNVVWRCSKCDTGNTSSSHFCKACGNSR